MTKKWLAIYSVIALLGLIDAGYLTYTRFLGIVPPCSLSILSGCATVAKSSYSVLFGIPLSVYGMVFYDLALTITVLSFINIKIKKAQEIIFAISLAGAVSSIYFLYLQAFVIKAFCIYCVFSALCSFALLAISFFWYKTRTILLQGK